MTPKYSELHRTISTVLVWASEVNDRWKNSTALATTDSTDHRIMWTSSEILDRWYQASCGEMGNYCTGHREGRVVSGQTRLATLLHRRYQDHG